jgi:phosphate transport system permease protein
MSTPVTPRATLAPARLPVRRTAWTGGAAGALVLLAVGLAAGVRSPAWLVVLAAVGLAAGQVVGAAVAGGRRVAVDRLAAALVAGAFLIALAPLLSVLGYTLSKGVHRFDGDFFYRSLNGIGARDAGGGAYHALLGTLEQVGIATLLSVPLGLLVAVYIVEYGRGRAATYVRFLVDVMTGIPSIVAGLFVLSFWVLGLGQGFSGFAAALALSVLMIPIVVRSAEEMLRLVPGSLREGSLALGVPQWRTILKVVVPTALPGIVTGIMLAVARVMGETAPVLLTAFGANAIVSSPFAGPQASLPLFIYQQAGDAQQTAVNRAWTAALALVLVVMALNLVARVLTRRSKIGR